jgi:hypothetical protein
MLNRWNLFQAATVTSVVQGLSAHILEEYIDQYIGSITDGVLAKENRQQIASAITTCVSAYLGAKASSALGGNARVANETGHDDLLDNHGNCVALLSVVSSIVVHHFTKIKTSATFKVVSAVLAGLEFCEVLDENPEVFRIVATL